MAFIEYGGKRHAVPAGEMLVGAGADCHLRLEGPGIGPRHAVLTTAPDASVSIRRLDEGAAVEVNGIPLGGMPQPLLHGDKVTIGAIELLFVDERKSGSTQYVSAVKLQDLAGAAKPKAGAGKATTATGGRVVSLTDGREYTVVGASLKFGRDANSDVVVAGTQVSRRHAEIVVSPRGYIVVDSSTNGIWVNGERVQNQRLLARADVIRIGEEEFRFYADIAPAAPAAAPAPAVPSPAAPPAAAPPAFSGPPTPQAMAAPSQPPRAPAFPASPVLQAPPPRAPVPPAAPEVVTPVAPPPAALVPPPMRAPVPPAAVPPPASSAQLVSTGYFPSPGKPAAPAPPPPAAQPLRAAPPAQPAAPPVAAAPAPVAAAPLPPAASIPLPPAASSRPAPSAVPAAPQAPSPPPAAPPPAAQTPAAQVPAAAPPPKPPQALAKFVVRSGGMKGQRLYVKVPIVNIGRADYNDLVIPDDSVSSQHAKLTRREGVWILTDLGSTNGTLVDGERIAGDTPIAPGAFVRFGDIQLAFEPTDDDAGIDKQLGTRAISAVKLSDIKPPQGR
jgi:pSer/pThr/pTyr-binding forkhead associated (FHA) protein